MVIKFFTKSKAEFQMIYARIIGCNRFDQSAKTGLVVPQGAFSNKYQKIRDKAEISNRNAINYKLIALKKYLAEQYNDTIINNSDFSKLWLKQKIDVFFDRVTETERYKKFFVAFAEHYNETETINKRTGKPLAAGTIKKYKLVLKYLKEYEELKNSTLLLKSITYDFYKDFVVFCRKTKKFADNTTGSNIKIIKQWLSEANKRGYCDIDLSDFTTMTNETKDIYLTDNEINKIFSYDFSSSLRLSNARDLFIIGARSGLRISDFMRLDIDNINDNFIEIKAQKTGESVVIPMHPQINVVLKRNGGKLPRSISEQKFNDYIKEICMLVGIDAIVEGGKLNPKTRRKEYGKFPKYELVSSHTCRRSFASNLYGKIPNTTIMGITGHKTEKEFLKYIKITPKQNAQRLKEYYDSQENNKNTIASHLTIVAS